MLFYRDLSSSNDNLFLEMRDTHTHIQGPNWLFKTMNAEDDHARELDFIPVPVSLVGRPVSHLALSPPRLKLLLMYNAAELGTSTGKRCSLRGHLTYSASFTMDHRNIKKATTGATMLDPPLEIKVPVDGLENPEFLRTIYRSPKCKLRFSHFVIRL